MTARPAETESVVAIRGVSKAYGPTRAVDGVTLEVGSGEMFGLIGPDGAGKTTLLRLVCGLLVPDEGQVRLFGYDPARARREAAASIGYVSQRFSLYGDLSIDENIEFFARIHGVRDFAARRTRLLQLTGLLPFRRRLAARLSGGMKQKLALACTLVHEPPLLVLDEPTTGVDPVSRREFWKLLAEFLASGLTIVMATPYLDEAERCGRVALLSEGRLLALEAPKVLQAGLRGIVLEIVATPSRQALEVARRVAGAEQVELFGDRLHVRASSEAIEPPLRSAFASEGVAVAVMRRITPSLEDIFIERVTEANAEPAAP